MPLSELSIGADGSIAFIYSDETLEFVTEATGGSATTRRASHVDKWFDLSDDARRTFAHSAQAREIGMLPVYPPLLVDLNRVSEKWFADLLPVGGPVLGPFDRHAAAIAAELSWLGEHFPQALRSLS